jgi:hypothetical protein
VTELIDDFDSSKPPSQRGPERAPLPISAPAIGDALEGFDPAILNVHCYEDVGYPWVHVVFDQVITPAVALAVGDKLATADGVQRVYLNSLRPRGVYFVLEPPLGAEPDLKAARYGELLTDLKTSWNGRSAKRGAAP